MAKRVMQGLIAYNQATNFVSIQSSYWRAGIELNYDNGKPVLKVNINTWLVQRNSPNSNVKREFFINKTLKKQARVKTSVFGLTKKQQRENNEKEVK